MANLKTYLLPITMAMALICPTPSMAEKQHETPETIKGLLLASEEQDNEEKAEQNKETRVYLDLYGFLPWQTTTDLKIDENKASMSQNLGEVLEPATAVFTGRAGLEFDRFGVQLGVNHGSSYTSDKVHSWKDDNPIRNSKQFTNKFPNLIKNRRIKSTGDITVDNTFRQTVVDLAFRYRGGAVPSPRMKPGEFAFIGLAGARIVDASMNVDLHLSGDVEFEGIKLDKKFRKKFEHSANEDISNTWVSPLLGMNGIYAFNDQWQAFVYLDAAGFGVSGKKDMSGTAQAGIAYSIGNSTQLSLSYKYWGINYAGYGTNNEYNVSQSGLNLGLRLFYD